INVFAGVGGPYWGDTAANQADAIGIALGNVDFGLALLKPTDITDRAKYTALKVTASSAALVGLESFLQLSATDIVVGVNQVGGFTLPGARAIDWSSAPLSVPTGNPAKPVSINFKGDLIRVSIADALVQVSQFIYARGSFAFEKGQLLTVTPENGSPKTVTSVTLGGSGINVFAGVGGPYWGDTAANQADAIGIALGNVDFGLALLKPTDITDRAKYTALKVTASSAALVGLESFLQLSATDIVVGVNQVGGFTLPGARAIDWSS